MARSAILLASLLATASPAAATATAGPTEIKGTGATLVVDLSELPGLRLHRNFLGLPYVFIQESAAPGTRSSVSVTPTGIDGAGLDPGTLRATRGDYRDGRRKHAQRRGLSIERFLPVRSLANGSGAKVVSTGHERRERDGARTVERSIYVLCPGEMFHVKSLSGDRALGGAVVRAVEGSRCE